MCILRLGFWTWRAMQKYKKEATELINNVEEDVVIYSHSLVQNEELATR